MFTTLLGVASRLSDETLRLRSPNRARPLFDKCQKKIPWCLQCALFEMSRLQLIYAVQYSLGNFNGN